MSKELWYNAEMFYYSLLWLSADKNGIHDKMSFGVIDSSLRVTIPFSIFLTKRSCLCLEWQESIRRYPKHSKESAAMMRGTLNVILNEREGSVPAVSSFRFPAFSYSILTPAQNDTRRQGVIMRETLNVILSTSEESVAVVRKAGKLSSEVIDSSPCHCPVFCFSHKAFLSPFRMTTDGKRHPERMWRICDCGEGNGKSLVGSYERNRVITPHHIDAFMLYRLRTCCKFNWEVPLNSGIFYCIAGIKMEKMGVREKYFKKISNYFSCFSKFKLERDTIMAALRTVPFRRGNRERRKEYG